MANTLRIKRRITGAPGAPGALKNAELAYNEVDNVLYYGKGDAGDGTATSIIQIAGSGTFATKEYVDTSITNADLSSYAKLAANNTFAATYINTFNGTVNLEGVFKIDDAAVNTSAAELNLLDGAIANTVVNSAAVIYGSAGQITANNYNKVTITAPATGSTLTIADGKTFTVSNTLTFTGTDSSSVAFGAGGTVAYTANKLSAFAATTSSELAGVISDETGTGALVFANTPTLVTPILGTPTSGTLTNCTGLPVSTGISGLAAGVATFLATPSSANLIGAVTDETGTGALVFANTPTLVTPILGTPTSGTLTNCTELPVSTGISGLGTGVATFLATPTSANLAAAVTDETGSGSLVFGTSPQFTTSVTTNSTSFDVFNTNAATVNAFGVAQTLNIAGGSPPSRTVNIAATTTLFGNTVNIATTASATGNTNVNIGHGASGGGTSTVTINGNLVVNGTTTTLNTNTMTVDDKEIELGSVAAITGLTATLTAGMATVSVTSTVGMIPGQSLAKTAGTGAFGATARILSVNSPTQFTVESNHATSGSITFDIGGATDNTAENGGIRLKGATDKTINWTSAAGWTSSEDFNVASGKVYRVAGTSVLSATALGSGVVSSSLTSVGTIGTGVWQGTAVAVAYGGTGATTAAGARSSLGLAIGTDVQAYDAELNALAGLTSAADALPYFTGSGTASTTTLSSFGRTLIDDANAAAAQTTLGLVIGTNVQAYDAELAAIAGLTSAADRLPYFTGSGTASLAVFTSFGRSLVDDTDAAAARTTLGLGTIATQNANNVAITGGTIDNIVLDGGTF